MYWARSSSQMTRPGVRRLRDVVCAEHEVVRPAAVGHAVRLSVQTVVVLALDPLLHVCVVRDELGVDRGDLARRHQPHARVARGGDAVVLAGLDQRDHVVGAAAVLRVHRAARRLRELLRQLRIARPLDDVDLAFLARLLLDLLERAAEALDRAGAAVVAAASRGDDRQGGDQSREGSPRAAASLALSHPFLPLSRLPTRARAATAAAACAPSTRARRSRTPPGSASEPGAHRLARARRGTASPARRTRRRARCPAPRARPGRAPSPPRARGSSPAGPSSACRRARSRSRSRRSRR